VSTENEIAEIKKRLKEHENRIRKLETLEKEEGPKAPSKKPTISDHLDRLKSQGFFSEPKLTTEIVEKLAAEGFHYPPESLTWSLQKAVQTRNFGRVKKDKKWAYCKR
jgi:DNA-directed RNA polymerase alpha subunit